MDDVSAPDKEAQYEQFSNMFWNALEAGIASINIYATFLSMN